MANSHKSGVLQEYKLLQLEVFPISCKGFNKPVLCRSVDAVAKMAGLDAYQAMHFSFAEIRMYPSTRPDSSGAHDGYSHMVMFIRPLIIDNSIVEVGFDKEKTPKPPSPTCMIRGAVCAVGVFQLEYLSSFHDDSCCAKLENEVV